MKFSINGKCQQIPIEQKVPIEHACIEKRINDVSFK